MRRYSIILLGRFKLLILRNRLLCASSFNKCERILFRHKCTSCVFSSTKLFGFSLYITLDTPFSSIVSLQLHTISRKFPHLVLGGNQMQFNLGHLFHSHTLHILRVTLCICHSHFSLHALVEYAFQKFWNLHQHLLLIIPQHFPLHHVE